MSNVKTLVNNPNKKIHWLAKNNPVRFPSEKFTRWEVVRKFHGKTVKAYLAANGNKQSLKNAVKFKAAKVA